MWSHSTTLPSERTQRILPLISFLCSIKQSFYCGLKGFSKTWKFHVIPTKISCSYHGANGELRISPYVGILSAYLFSFQLYMFSAVSKMGLEATVGEYS